MEEPKINPYLLVVIGVISVSTSAIFVKLSSAPSGVIAFYRLFFSVIIIFPLFLKKYIRELWKITLKDLLFSILAGILLAFHFILWFESLNYTSVASSTVLVTLQPLFAFVGTYFFYKEKIHLRSIISALVAIGGSILISWGDFYIDRLALYGDILALAACALITAYLLFGQSVRKRVSLITYTFIVYSFSSITLFFYVLFNGQSFFSYPMSDWIYFILLAIIPTLLGHSLFNWALQWISTNIISVAILFEPVGASLLAFLIFGEKLFWNQWLGGIIVIIGIGIFSFNKKLQINQKEKTHLYRDI